MKDMLKSGSRSVGAAKASSAKPSSTKPTSNGSSAGKSGSKKHSFRLDAKLLTAIHDNMVKSRVLEERLIKMYKQNDGYFWIGGPGEEAFNTALGMHIKKGQGPKYDFLHLHYRSSAIMLAMGADPMDSIRQMKNTATDPYSGGRNFGNHYSKREWNVVPVSSTIETQYLTAIGTGLSQKRHGGTGITLVNGGDAGTAEGDFASCLVWSTRPGNELPIVIVVVDNQWGISTPACTQHGEKNISDRGKAFGMETLVINGNDVEEAWFGVKKAFDYVRKERKPFFLEAKCSRLYGHSSASGANRVENEVDTLVEFERQLESAGVMTRKQMDQIRENYTQQMLEMAQKVKTEPMPDGSTIYDHTYFGQKGRYW